MKVRHALFASSILWCSLLHAADIYRWIDGDGRTQFSDFVPEQYKRTATKIDSKQFELSAAQHAQAKGRAALEKERAVAADAKRRKAQVEGEAASTPASAPVGIGVSPRSSANDDADCATLRRLYRESQECFAPFFTAHRGIKAEAFEKCTERSDPSLKCGHLTSR